MGLFYFHYMKTRSLLVFVCTISVLISQHAAAQMADSAGVYSFAPVMPAYAGGDAALYRYVGANIQYPKDAVAQKLQGKVQVKTVIDEKGNITDAKIVRGVCPSIDEEALRVIRSTSGSWESGRVDERPAKVYKYLSVNFRIDTTNEAVAPISFIGGEEAFHLFIREHIEVPNALLVHPELWGAVTTSVTFNSLNQIANVEVLKGPHKDLNDEAVRLIKLSQGKWMRGDMSRAGESVTLMLTIPFNETMVDSSLYKKTIVDNFILNAYNTNPVFKRAYDNFELGNYAAARPDLDICIHSKKDVNAALLIRAYCLLYAENYAEACQDLVIVKTTPGMDTKVSELYYKYCSGPHITHRHLPTSLH